MESTKHPHSFNMYPPSPYWAGGPGPGHQAGWVVISRAAWAPATCRLPGKLLMHEISFKPHSKEYSRCYLVSSFTEDETEAQEMNSSQELWAFWRQR